MTYTATVTNQGQVTIPAPLRKKFFPKGIKIVFEIKTYNHQEQIVIQAAPKLEDIVGIAQKHKPLPKNFSLEKTIKEATQEATHKADTEDRKIMTQL